MHPLYSTIKDYTDTPILDGGKFHILANKLLDLCESLEDNKITLVQFKLELKKLRNDTNFSRHQNKKEVFEWIDELVKSGK